VLRNTEGAVTEREYTDSCFAVKVTLSSYSGITLMHIVVRILWREGCPRVPLALVSNRLAQGEIVRRGGDVPIKDVPQRDSTLYYAH